MTNDQTGRTPRQTTGGSPAASTVMIVVTVIAVVAGFFILKQIRDDDTGGSPTQTSASSQTTSTTVDPNVTTTTVTAVTTTVFTTTGTSVVVANASQANGVAKALSTELGSKGFAMGDPTNATGEKLAASKIYYITSNPSALAVANSVASLMGITAIEPMPAAIPTSSAALADGVGVLVMLGNDKAGKALAAMGGATTETTLAGATASTATTLAPA